ncbi:MAG: cytidine deaminase [Firmicutes bacterium]|nr:cytidine deaminase [Dethiobacter sp.]MBS3888403.1 cytidine deaminase [Bacillota bacterium]MBS4055463.1 cytidine deaminase [Thermaerobacter sp.]
MHNELIKAAQEALTRAYAPYSGYRVGAAILSGGQIYLGANVENASYGLSMCAERSAVFAAISAGAPRSIEAVAIAIEKGLPSPCGACRQVLREFGEDFPVYLVGGDGQVHETSLAKLLPDSFGPQSLTKGEIN